MIKAILVDDAAQVRKLLQLMLKEVATDVEVVAEADNVDSAIEQIRRYKPTVVFLDIDMPGKNGLQLIDQFETSEIDFEIIFITAYNQYAINAFRQSAVDYLMKPVREKELVDAVEKVRKGKKLKKDAAKFRQLSEHLNQMQSNTLAIPVNYGTEYIEVADIEFVEADGAYSIIYLINGSRKVVSRNLKYFEDALCELKMFVKAHRSYIINLNNMNSFRKEDRGVIVLKSGKEINISRGQRQAFFEKLEKR